MFGVVTGRFDTGGDKQASRAKLVSYGIDSTKAAFLADYMTWYLDSLRRMGTGSLADSIEDADTEAEAIQLGNRLGFRGIARLGGSQMKDFVAFRSNLLHATTVEQCARVTRGPRDAELMMRVLARADTADIRSAYGIVLEGVAAELTADTPQPGYSQERTEAAWNAFIEQLPPADQERFASISQRLGSASDENACWAERTMWNTLDELPAEHAEVVYAEMAAAAGGTAGG